jgi:hypothetical protein
MLFPQIKRPALESVEMDALEAVLDLVKDRDEIASELETYESWFESLVGKNVTLTLKHKKKTRYVECIVTEFTQGEGWELQSTDEEDEIFMVTFEDFVSGKVYIN